VPYSSLVLSPFTEKANIICQVVDTDGRPIPYVEINIYREGTHLSQGWTNVQGLVFFERLSPGNIRISAERTGYQKYTMDEFVIKAGDTSTVINVYRGNISISTISINVLI